MKKPQWTIQPAIFREYDIRGIADRDLNADFAYGLGLAYARYLQKAKKPQAGRALKVSVGRDCRLTGEAYATSLIRGLTESGLDVVRLGVCPTPLTYFSIFHLELDGGIMVTGSHNPANYNGFKMCVGKDTLHGSQIQDLKAVMISLLEQPTPSAGRLGAVTDYSIIPAYIDEISKGFKGLRPLKVVLDAGNGTAGPVAPPLFERLGAQIIPLYCEMDGRFPNHHPDPTVPENLKDLVAAVLKEKADIGIAFDGDSDRIGVVDEKGKILFGDELMVLFSRDVLKTSPGATIISEVKSSHRLYEDIAKHGGVPIMWKTGHSLIKSKMKETRAALAGEMSGHIFFADRYYGYDDAIYAAARVFEIASRHTRGPLSTLLSDLTPTVSTPEIRVDCEEEKKFRLVDATKAILKKDAALKINEIDGVRVDFGDGWGLLRASNTQPVLVLRFEAPTAARLGAIRKVVESALKTAAEQIGHAPVHTDRAAAH